MKQLINKLKESASSVLPIMIIVVLLSFTPIFNVSTFEIVAFIISSILLIVSMALFNMGAEMAMSPMGEYVGVGLLKLGKLSVLLIVTLALGLLITVAEPDLMVLASQVAGVIDGNVLIIAVGIGVGVFLVIAILKIIAHKPLANILMLFYLLIFALVALMCELGRNGLLPMSFDSGGVTTGPMTVPFIMAFGLGVATSIGGKDANENSFGLVSLCSVGPIIVVLLLSIMSKGNIDYQVVSYTIKDAINEGLHNVVFQKCIEIGKALGILFVFFMIVDLLVLKLPINKLVQIIVGILITFVGLVFFLSIVEVGYLPIGYAIGVQLTEVDRNIMIGFGFLIGMTVVLAEPAVQVLNRQVEDVTSGSVTRISMMIALSIGVGISIALSIVRQIYDFSILYYLIPGYFLSLALSLFVPPLYTSIAFDSGGVASGPMTSTFILPMMIGICMGLHGKDSVMSLAFGVVALVAMTPLITIQLLGFKSIMSKYIRDRIVMKRILTADDNKIIYFDV